MRIMTLISGLAYPVVLITVGLNAHRHGAACRMARNKSMRMLESFVMRRRRFGRMVSLRILVRDIH